MLIGLSIRDIVLIDRLDLDFSGGLSVLTGETGAGKSILLDALSLALGARGEGGLVRHGATQGQVSAIFDVSERHPARVIAEAAGIETGGEIILRRVQFADGRSRAFVNDQAASVQVLRAIGQALVEIHGQHADRAMIDPATHRALVDGFAGLDTEAIDLARLHSLWRAAEKAALDAETRLAASRKEADFLRHAAAELDTLSPETGEEEALANRRQAMMGAERTIADLRDALDLISGESAPGATILSALRRIERRRENGGEALGGALVALEAALSALDEAQYGLEAALRASEFEPRELERVEERLFALRAAARKYQVPVHDLAALAARYAADLDLLDHGEADLARLRAHAREAEALLRLKSVALSQKRRHAAGALDAAIGAELPPLKLERARFSTEIESDPERLEATGIDRVEFHVATNPGTRPGPMMKIASGGELARFMLALKVALADRGSAPTLVFDEIDTGVGGAVADAIGARLARLSERVQVLAVTHAPQVAARAAHHFQIAKGDIAGDGVAIRVATRVSRLDAGARREEIARMLSGAAITDEARAAAQRLLEA
jgi:DNA repair protein RecN (Recombination protein N)